MSKQNDTNTVKLKVSHLRGYTAKKAVIAINKEFEKFFREYYIKITNGLITYTPKNLFYSSAYAPFPSVSNQSDITHFISHQERSWTNILFINDIDKPVFPKVYTEELLLFNDSLHMLVRIAPRTYGHKPDHSSVYDIRFEATIIDKQCFLDSLNIEPNLSIPKYVDIIGNEIHEGDVVVTSAHEGSRLYLDKVKKLTPYSIALENGSSIRYDVNYQMKIAVISDVPIRKSK